MLVAIHASDVSHGSMLSRAKSVDKQRKAPRRCFSFFFFLLIFDKIEKHKAFQEI